MTSRVLADDEYGLVTEALVRMAGLVFDASRRGAISAIVTERMNTTKHPTVDSYLAFVESALGVNERQQLLDAVTIQETHFFRNLPQIDALRRDVLPDLLRRNRATGRPLTIWSAGCSTGEEPYTIAITAMQAFNSKTPPVRILATDIDTNVLETARRGTYSSESVSAVDPEILRRYFLRGAGANEGSVKVRPEVAALVSFRRLNLLDQSWQLRGGFTALFCRNVMIYFDKETQYSIIHRMAPLLETGGLLFAGHSENFSDARDLLRLRGRTIYERLAGEVSARRPG